MITWIASYPKSGKTWMKLFLKSYFNSENTTFSINSKSDDLFTVETFPISKKFKELNINYKDFSDIAKNWINMQSLINLNNKNNYIKTHNAMCSINNYEFTDNESEHPWKKGQKSRCQGAQHIILCGNNYRPDFFQWFFLFHSALLKY